MKCTTLSIALTVCFALATSVQAQHRGRSTSRGGQHRGGGHSSPGGGSHAAPRPPSAPRGPSAPRAYTAPRAVPHAYGGVGFGQTNRPSVTGGAKRLAPTVQRGVNAPPKSSFVNPHGPTRTNNYPKPQYAANYGFGSRADMDKNYEYAAGHYAPHVANFYGWQSPGWGGHWRYGYFAPRVGFGWGFGFYVFSPFYAACVASPWYYDPWDPPYLLASQVVYDPGYAVRWASGSNYDWVNGPNPALNAACGEITSAYTSGNADPITNLIGGGEIAIFMEGRYEYSLNASDFVQMLRDNLQATQSVSFTITGVHLGKNHAVVHATHVFTDPSGGTDTVYQKYRLQYLDGAYVVTDFMTSHTPI